MWQDYQPAYIQPNELATFGLPSTGAQANILSLVEAASSILDIYCNTKDSTGYGSLAWSTYSERVRVKTNRAPNIFRVSHRPLVGVDAATLTNYATSGFDNAVQSTSVLRMNGQPGELCSILALSGRYGSSRNDDLISAMLPYITPTSLLQEYGGPPVWYAMDPSQTDYNPRTAEVWAPPGVFLYKFAEIDITYTAGFDPFHVPRSLKRSCAMIVSNMLAKPLPGLKSANFTDAALIMQFAEQWIDPTTAMNLLPFIRNMYA